MSDKPDIEFNMNLPILEHLGYRTHTNLPSVIAEYVANAWDAGATKVDVLLPQQRMSDDYEITISDNGIGMTINEINDKLLRVGRKRREEDGSSLTVNGRKRKILGRKGIGFLSGFGIANVINVKTCKNGECIEFEINSNDIVDSNRPSGEVSPYSPTIIEHREANQLEGGTKITLKDINRKRRPSEKYVRQKLSRQFSFRDGGMEILINGEKIDVSDAHLKDKCQFTWEIDEKGIGDGNLEISGWIGTLKSPVSEPLEKGISIIANGRMVQKPTVFDADKETYSGRIALEYIVGEIHADFLDSSDEDLIKPNRESLIWNREPATSLRTYLNNQIKEVAKEWVQKRRDVEPNVTPARVYKGKSLEELVYNREDTIVEYKEEFPNQADDIAKEVVGLANVGGGVLLLGVEDEGKVVGLDQAGQTEERVSGVIRSNIRPTIRPDIRRHTIEGKEILVVDIDQQDVPISTDGRFLIRVGSTNEPMAFREMIEKFLDIEV